MPCPIDISEKSGVRYLHFGSSWVQGAMRIKQPFALELEYTRDMLAALLFLEQPPQNILIIGLGAASLTKFLYRHYPQSHLTVVEIEPAVVAAARQYFHLPNDTQRLHIVIADGAQYLQEKTQKFDLILVDGYDQNGRAGPLDTLPFYQACRNNLAETGILSTNLLGRSHGYNESLSRIQLVFDDCATAFASSSGNVVVLAGMNYELSSNSVDIKRQANELLKNLALNSTVAK